MPALFDEFRKEADFYCGQPATAVVIENAEKTLGLQFSGEYKEYLTVYGVLTARGHELTGIIASPRLNVVAVTKREKERKDDVPPGFYVIEETNIGGVVVWQDRTGQVFQTSDENGPEFLCGSLYEYLLMDRSL